MSIFQELKSTKTVLFGAGYWSNQILQFLITDGVIPAYFVDNDLSIKEKNGFIVNPPAKLLKEDKSRLKIVIATRLDYYNEIKEQCNEMGLAECIWDYKNDHELSYRMKYYVRTSKPLNLENPKTFDEKIFYLQLHDHNPLYRRLTDKIMVKDYVAEKIGGNYVVPIIGIWDDPNDIPFEDLPDEYVLKCNHDSGWVFIKRRKDKPLTQSNIQEIRKKLSENLKVDYFLASDTYGYKDILPKVFAEELIYTRNNERLIDYKIFCFNGEPRFLYAARDREALSGVAFYDLNYNRIPVYAKQYPVCADIPKPEPFDEMIDCARKLAAGIPFVRVDLYVNGGGAVIFSEMTFAPSGGALDIHPEEFHIKFGNYLDLSVVNYTREKRCCVD